MKNQKQTTVSDTVQPENTITLLTGQQARQSPCMQCHALCCNVLHLEDIGIKSLADFDKVSFYLNFEHISVILSSDGKFTVFYERPCRFFKTENHSCTIHNQPEQPSICVNYNPFRCFYRQAESDREKITHGYAWMNHQRLRELEKMFLFDTERQIAQAPPFENVIPAMDNIPYNNKTENGQTETSDNKPATDAIQPTPCKECNGQCCTHLVFPIQKPDNLTTADYTQYTLGFPDVRCIIMQNNWYLTIPTRCRHLDRHNLCSLYEKPERPIECRYLSPERCHIRQVLRSPETCQIDYERFVSWQKKFVYDPDDHIINLNEML